MFEKATKAKAKLRMAITAPAGGGKTYSALSIGSGFGGKMAVLDTEHGSASKYADRFDFDTVQVSAPHSINSYIEVINEASRLGYTVLIIDSLSHAWQYLLEKIDQLQKTKYHGNSFMAWSEGTPEQKKLIEAILSSDCHIIGTMRVSTEYAVEKNEKGKMAPRKVGLKPEQRAGLEYEFDIILEGNTEHYFTCTKDRSGNIQDRIIEKPTKDLGVELVAWLNDGVDLTIQIQKLLDELESLRKEKENIISPELNQWCKAVNIKTDKKIILTGIERLKNAESRKKSPSNSPAQPPESPAAGPSKVDDSTALPSRDVNDTAAEDAERDNLINQVKTDFQALVFEGWKPEKVHSDAIENIDKKSDSALRTMLKNLEVIRAGLFPDPGDK